MLFGAFEVDSKIKMVGANSNEIQIDLEKAYNCLLGIQDLD